MGKKERALLAAPREEPRRPRLAQVLEVHRRDHVQKHARGEEPADPLRGQVGDALDVRDEVAVAVPHHVPDLGIVAGRVRLHLPAQPNPVGEELNVRLAHGLERVLPAFPLGGPLEDLERLPEAARDACLEELLLRTEEAEHVRLRDAGLLRDRLRGGTVEAARCELLERRVEHRLASLLGGLPFRADSHGSKLSLTYCHVKGCAVRPAAYLRSLNPQLPLPVWLLQVGGLTNSFGNGLALPFLVIYLHNVRGFSLGTSGLVVAVSSAGQLVAGVLAGPVIDRFGARRTLATGLVLQAVGYGLLPLVRHPWEAFALVALEGAGSAGFWPSQSTLISRLTPTARRHAAFAQQRVTMNLGIGLGGLAAGWIAKVHDPRTFTILFVLDAFTFLAYVGVLAFVRDPGVVCSRPPPQDVPRPLGAQFPVRGRRLLALQPLAGLRPRPVASQRAADRGDLLRQHRGHRPRAAADRPLDRRSPPHACARAHAAPLGRGLADRGRRRLLADGDFGLRRARGRRRDPRHRRVLPRPRAPGARVGHRSAPPAGALLRRAQSLVGPCGHGRPCGRRLHPRRCALCPLAARLGRVPPCSGACVRARALRPEAPPADPAQGGGGTDLRRGDDLGPDAAAEP